MQKSDFYYDLPEELIAQTPADRRDRSRMLVLDRASGRTEDRLFFEVTEYLRPGDCLVLNNTRVFPARICGETLNGGKMEFLLLFSRGGDIWEALAKPGRKAVPGARFRFGGGAMGAMEAEVLQVLENGNRLVRLCYGSGDLFSLLDRIGEMPLPHYIHEKLKDKERYQTVYSRELGSVAAPTAGLHFTSALLEEIETGGVELACVTLHVGVGTFRPVKTEKVEDHVMHREHYDLPAGAAEAIRRARARGGRVIAVGTTSCRTLEGVFAKWGDIRADTGDTGIFIYPPYRFRAVDGLITNFHLPESTLIMLVSAFAGRENVLAAYRHAVAEKYRFFSFGDACLIL